MAQTLIEGSTITLRGATVFDGSASLPASSVTNAAVAAAAGIDASKLEHRHRPLYTQPNTTATSVTQVIYVAKAAGTVNSFRAGSIAACAGAATITVDLKKNGSTILSAVITLDSSNSNYVPEAGTVNTAAYVADDVFTIVTVATAGGGTIGTGFYCIPEFEEAAS